MARKPATRAQPVLSTALTESLLDDSQRAFCSCPTKAIRLLAPAGSGKTLSLLWRCINFQQIDPAHNERFLIFTFTRVARDELKDRLSSDKTYAPLRDFTEICTLNQWGYRRIRALAHNTKLLTSDADRYFCLQNLLQPVWRRHPAVMAVVTNQKPSAKKAIMTLIDRFKTHGFRHDLHQQVDAFAGHLSWMLKNGQEMHAMGLLQELEDLELVPPGLEGLKLVEAAHNGFFRFWIDACTLMYESAVFTLEDQKYWALIDCEQKLTEGRFTTGAQRYHHVLVDEFQDINTLDLALLKCIGRLNKAELTIVGDDDQAIYEWRGATPRYILHPDQHLDSGYETFTLEVNYRSPRNIVERSQRLIQNNRNRVPKAVRAVGTKDARIDVLAAGSLTDSIDYVTATVKELLAARGDDPHRVAIVGRKRSQIIPYQIIFASQDIPFFAAEDLQVFLSKAFEDLKQLLLCHSRRDLRRSTSEVVEDVLRLCDQVKRYPLKKTDKQPLRAHLIAGKPRTLKEAVDVLRAYHGQLKGSNDGGRMSESFADAITSFLAAGTVSDAIGQISLEFQGLQKDYGKSEEDIFYVDPPFLYLSEYAERYGDDIVEFIDDMEKAVETLAQVPSDDGHADKSFKRPLHLMTALRAKGKEYDTVIILDVNDGIWPSKLAVTDEQKEQERRIFYVGVTRARRRLILITNTTMMGEPAAVSPYLAEMGLDPTGLSAAQ